MSFSYQPYLLAMFKKIFQDQIYRDKEEHELSPLLPLWFFSFFLFNSVCPCFFCCDLFLKIGFSLIKNITFHFFLKLSHFFTLAEYLFFPSSVASICFKLSPSGIENFLLSVSCSFLKSGFFIWLLYGTMPGISKKDMRLCLTGQLRGFA